MNRRTTISLMITALLCLAVSLQTGRAVAQQKQQVSINIPGENGKFGLQQNVVVGDAPNHIVRVFELHYAIPTDAPAINGVKLTETWLRGTSEIADGAGRALAYLVFTMENGDKFFVRVVAIIQPAAGKLAATGVGHITGGTGKLGTIQGTARFANTFDPIAGVPGAAQIDIEYSIGK